jgi:hypothetical protein
MKKLVFFSALATLLVGGAQGKTPRSAWPRLLGSSTYISIQQSDKGHRSQIEIINANFIMRSVGSNPTVGAGSHDGGAIFVNKYHKFVELDNIGIILPRASGSWNFANRQCNSDALTADLLTVQCSGGGQNKALAYVYSKRRGVLAFTGFCWIAPDHICDYVLVSDFGVASRGH